MRQLVKKNLKVSAVLALAILNLPIADFSVDKALAADNFFLEIGKPSSAGNLQEYWQELSEKYKKTLGRLKLYPKSVVNQEGETNSIIQAGPLTDKNKAQKICNMLFTKDIPCFVIEGIEEKPPTMSIDIAHATRGTGSSPSLPWLDIGAAPQISAYEETEESSIRKPNGEAEVDVAEAIAVPLSDAKQSPVASNLEVRKPINTAREFPSVKFSSSTSGKLNIGYFVSENEASSFWNYVNEEHKELADNLHARIQKSLSFGKNGGVQLMIGQFPSSEAAANFCNQTILGFSANLKCRYDGGDNIFSNTSSNDKGDTSTARADTYERRRLLASGRRLPARQMELLQAQETQDTISAPESVQINDVEQIDKKFWVQVAIADSKDEAQYRLKEIKKANSKTIGNLTSNIAYSPSSVHGKYAAQIGTISSESEAQKICDKLQQRGVDCLVVSK